MPVSSTWIVHVKVLLILSGLVSISMLINFSVPLVIQFILYQVPIIWSCIMSLLRPPYLYFVINGIIIIIAVTSRYTKKAEDTGESEPLVPRPNHVVVYDEVVSPEVVKEVVVNGAEDDEFVVSRSMWTPPGRSKSFERLPEDVFSKPPEKPLLLPEKPLVSTRVVRAPTSSPQGGKPSRAVNPKQNETLENTWKTITEARQISLLNKHDTRENQDRPLIPAIAANPKFKKSATFRDRTNYDRPVNSSPRPRKEPSLSGDELNRRAEAFIKKVNNEMRLQRLESLDQYTEMINRGTR